MSERATCEACGVGLLEKHCPETNRCGWWICDLSCGFVVDLRRGTASNLRDLRGLETGERTSSEAADGG